jgi:hypothetical protein
VVAIALGLVAGVVPIAAPDASALALISGACTTTFTVSFAPSMSLVPGASTMNLTGSGTCVANGNIGTVNIVGGMNSAAWSCEAGVAVGAVAVGFHVPGFNQSFFGVTAVAENVGGVITLEMTYNLTQLVGVGVFAQSPVSGASNCATGMSSTTWTGAFVFNDPDTAVELG